MKSSFAAVLVVVALATCALGQSTPVPSTQPSGASSGTTRIYVAFTESGGSMIRPGWLSTRLSESISKDLSAFTAVELLKPAEGQTPPRPEEGSKALLDLARQSGAEVAIVGSAKLADNKLSVAGDIFDLASSTSIAKFKADGSASDLFKVQDNVVHQVRLAVARIVGASPVTASTGSDTPAAPGSDGRYPGSALQRSLDNTNLKGLELGNSAGTRYDQQPYHVVEEPGINFLLPYYGGYGYGSCYGWPSYSYGSSWFPYYGGGYGWGNNSILVVQQTTNTTVNNPQTPTTPTNPVASTGNNGNNSGNSSNNNGNARRNRNIGNSGNSISRPANPPPLVATQPPLVRSAPAPRPAAPAAPSYEIRPVTR